MYEWKKSIRIGKLAWLIHIMAHILIFQKFTTNQMENGEEILDADYSKRVFTLSHSIAYRMRNVWTSEWIYVNNKSQKVDALLELALLDFFHSFRDT